MSNTSTSAVYENRATKEEVEAILAKGYTCNKYDLARILGCHPEHVLRMAREGQIPGRKYGKMWRFPVGIIVEQLEHGSIG